jgi:hypothetical protein
MVGRALPSRKLPLVVSDVLLCSQFSLRSRKLLLSAKAVLTEDRAIAKIIRCFIVVFVFKFNPNRISNPVRVRLFII